VNLINSFIAKAFFYNKLGILQNKNAAQNYRAAFSKKLSLFINQVCIIVLQTF